MKSLITVSANTTNYKKEYNSTVATIENIRKAKQAIDARAYGTDRIKKIFCHPNNFEWISEWANNNCGIDPKIPTFSPMGIDVEVKDFLPEFE